MNNTTDGEFKRWLAERIVVEELTFKSQDDMMVVEVSFAASSRFYVNLCCKAFEAGYYPDFEDSNGYMNVITLTKMD